MNLPAALCLALFAFAFLAGPSSCEWGLDAYFWVGVGLCVVLVALPWARLRQAPVRTRWLNALGWAGAGVGVWFAGFVLGGFRLMCRLM